MTERGRELAGQGVALGCGLIVMDDLVHNSLRAPLATPSTSTGYYLVSAGNAPQKPEARSFCEWVWDEFAERRQRMRELFASAEE